MPNMRSAVKCGVLRRRKLTTVSSAMGRFLAQRTRIYRQPSAFRGRGSLPGQRSGLPLLCDVLIRRRKGFGADLPEGFPHGFRA